MQGSRDQQFAERTILQIGKYQDELSWFGSIDRLDSGSGVNSLFVGQDDTR